jgi:NADH:ubiquinone oxidoreductase subunit K
MVEAMFPILWTTDEAISLVCSTAEAPASFVFALAGVRISLAPVYSLLSLELMLVSAMMRLLFGRLLEQF